MSFHSFQRRPRPTADRAPLPLGAHVPALDGLRGIAILLVCAFHFWRNGGLVAETPGFAWTSGLGWTGVDLFFVLSGLLITRILLDSRDRANYYRTFFARRILRIFPMYYAYVGAYLVAMPLAHMIISGGPFAPDGTPLARASVWTYLYNVAAGLGVAGTALPNLGHLWSLAIEEQFYLVWPFVVRRTTPRQLAYVCGGLMAAAPLARLACHLGGYPYAAYILTPCRVDALAAGALVALLVRRDDGWQLAQRWSTVVLSVALPVTAVIVLAPGGGPTDLAMSVPGHTALAIMFAAVITVIITAGRATSSAWISKLLTTRPLVVTGRHSYALYLVHHAIAFKLLAWGLAGPFWLRFVGSPVAAQAIHTLVGFSVSFAIARGCWPVIEQPFLRLKRHFNYEETVAVAPASIGSLALIGEIERA